MTQENMIIEYIRQGQQSQNITMGKDKKGNPIPTISGKRPVKGVLVSLKTSEGVGVGWSLAHKEDIFKKELGIKIATTRAVSNKPLTIPHSIKKHVEKFIDRSKRYFKTEENILYTVMPHEIKKEDSSDTEEYMPVGHPVGTM